MRVDEAQFNIECCHLSSRRSHANYYPFRILSLRNLGSTQIQPSRDTKTRQVHVDMRRDTPPLPYGSRYLQRLGRRRNKVVVGALQFLASYRQAWWWTIDKKRAARLAQDPGASLLFTTFSFSLSLFSLAPSFSPALSKSPLQPARRKRAASRNRTPGMSRHCFV